MTRSNGSLFPRFTKISDVKASKVSIHFRNSVASTQGKMEKNFFKGPKMTKQYICMTVQHKFFVLGLS